MSGIVKSLTSLFTKFAEPACKNGGWRDRVGPQKETEDGIIVCTCKEFFNGTLCEDIICINGGRRRGNSCSCPDAKHFSGIHCEEVQCANNGHHIGSGECRCPASYTGPYCEEYNNPWGVVIGCIAGLLLLIVLLWMLCQWYIGKREFERAYRRRSDGNGSQNHSGMQRYQRTHRTRVPPPSQTRLRDTESAIATLLTAQMLIQNDAAAAGDMDHANNNDTGVRVSSPPAYTHVRPSTPPPTYEEATSVCVQGNRANDSDCESDRSSRSDRSSKSDRTSVR